MICSTKTDKIKCQETFKARKDVPEKNQPAKKLKISDHEEPSSLMNKNQMRRK